MKNSNDACQWLACSQRMDRIQRSNLRMSRSESDVKKSGTFLIKISDIEIVSVLEHFSYQRNVLVVPLPHSQTQVAVDLLIAFVTHLPCPEQGLFRPPGHTSEQV